MARVQQGNLKIIDTSKLTKQNFSGGEGPMDPVTQYQFELYKKDVENSFTKIDSHLTVIENKIDTEVSKALEKQTKWLVGSILVITGIALTVIKLFM